MPNGDNDKGGTITEIGKTLFLFWKGANTVTRALMIIATVLVIGIIWKPWKEDAPTQQQTATQSGSNNVQNQAGRDVNVTNTQNFYSSNPQELQSIESKLDKREADIKAEAIAEMREDDERLKTNLRNIFPSGYALLTATDSSVIIPNPGNMTNIVFHWDGGYKVSFSNGNVSITLPEMEVYGPTGIHGTVGDVTVVLPERVGVGTTVASFGGGQLVAIVASVNTNRIAFAVGVRL
jgi:hypothetical protein